jgi:two-component system response regulator HydG
MEVLHNYSWPGNIRELRNVLERAVVLATSEKIGLKELPNKLLDTKESDRDSLKNKIDYYEKKVIVDTLEAHNWNKEEAARILGVDLATLYRKIKKLDITES